MTKNDIIKQLINNPEYDSEWVGTVAEIIVHKSETDKDYSIEDMNKDIEKYSNLNADQVEVIKLHMLNENNYFDLYKVIEEYTKDKDMSVEDFNATQMQLIGIMIDNENIPNTTIEKLIDCNIPYAKLNFVVKGLIEGYADMIDYIEYDPEQICEIYAGHKDGIDYTLYDKPDISDNMMGAARYALVNGLNVKFDKDVLIIS